MLIAAYLLRVEKSLRPFVPAPVAFLKRIVVAACSLREGFSTKLVGFLFRNRVRWACHDWRSSIGISRASTQAATNASLEVSIGILCETAATHFSLA